MTNPPPPPGEGDQPPPSGYPPPPPGDQPQPSGYPPPPGGQQPPPSGYPPPPPAGQPPGGYPPPPPAGQPPGGYPPPPSGGYPPPPPPQSGGFPPPGAPGAFPPPQGYPPYGGPPSYNIGDGLSWAWNKFSKNAVPLIVATLVFGVVLVVLQSIINLVQAAVSPTATSYVSDSGGFEFSYVATGPAAVFVGIIGWFLTVIVVAIVESAMISGVIDIANGQEVTVGSFFRPRNIGNVIVAALIVAIITAIGFVLCILPGLAASIFLMFTIVAVVDRNLSPVDSIKSSFETGKAHFGDVLLTWLAFILLAVVGAVLCGVGLLVTVPLIVLLLVYSYRVLNGGPVAPATP